MNIEQPEMTNVRTEWMRANVTGFAVGFALQALIGYALIESQNSLLARIAGFSAAGACIVLFQRRALRRFVRSSAGGGVLGGAALCICGAALSASGFMVGLYLFGVPFDHFAGFAALGLSAGLLLRGHTSDWRQWAWVCTVGFAIAGFIETAASVPLYLSGIHEAGLSGQVAFRLMSGMIGGAAVGMLTGPWLESFLPSHAGVKVAGRLSDERMRTETGALRLRDAHLLTPQPFNFQ